MQLALGTHVDQSPGALAAGALDAVDVIACGGPRSAAAKTQE